MGIDWVLRIDYQFIFDQSKNPMTGGMGGVKGGNKSINTSDTNMVDAYKGHGVFDSDVTTIFLSKKIFVIDVSNETAGSCCLYV